MISRVPMVSLERARELGEAMGMPVRRTQSEHKAFFEAVPTEDFQFVSTESGD